VKKAFASLLLAGLVQGCAGYHVGPAKPAYLRDVHTIAVPMFGNTTLVPRIEALITGTIIKQFQQDGTYRIANADTADAVLKGEIVAVSRSPARSLRGNVLSTTEFYLTISVKYSLRGRDGPQFGGAAKRGLVMRDEGRRKALANPERQARYAAGDESPARSCPGR
jgi:hypothetical protein